MDEGEETPDLKELVRLAALDPDIIAERMALAAFTAETFRHVGDKLHAIGYVSGTDRRDGVSPFGYGDDATVAVSLMLRIGSQLVSGAADLIADGRFYAGSSLVRQLVEVEYLAWAFETKSEEASRWLRSNRKERLNFFSPAKLRKESGGKFRSEDYSVHCELGGHPVPDSWKLLHDDAVFPQCMLSDSLGHSERIWNHVVGWATESSNGSCVLSSEDEKLNEMSARYAKWKQADPLTVLPPPPSQFTQ